MQRELYTVAEVRHVTGLSESRIYDLMRRGILPCVRIGRQRRVSRRALEGFIAQGGAGLSQFPVSATEPGTSRNER